MVWKRLQEGKSIRVTRDIYGHLLKDANPEAAAKTDALIFAEDAQAK